jgi:hypothetical protein
VPKATPTAPPADTPAASTPDQWTDPVTTAPVATGAPAPASQAAAIAQAQLAAKNGPLADTLPGLSEDTDYLAVCWYGLEGAGKTINLCSMAKIGPMVLLSAEAGAKILALKRFGIPTDNIRIWPNREKGERFDFAGLEALYYQIKAELVANPGCWVGGGMDSFTEIVRLFVIDERNTQYARAARKSVERGRFFTDRDDWGVVTQQLQEKLREFRSLPWHFGFTALERRDLDPDGKVAYGPAANPALMNDLPGFVDMLVHCQATEMPDGEDDVYLGWSKKHDGKYRAKDRYGVLPKVLPNPQFDRLLAYVRGALDPTNDPDLLEVKRRREQVAQAAAVAAEAATSAELTGAAATGAAR